MSIEADLPTFLFDDGPAGVAMTREESNPEWRRIKTGLNSDDARAIIRHLRAGKTWSETVEAFGHEIEAAVLENWRPELERRAGLPEGGVPVIPPRPGQMPDFVLPAAVEKARETLRFAEGALAEAQRDMGDFDVAVRDAEGAFKTAKVRCVLDRGTPAATQRVAEARELVEAALKAKLDASERRDAAEGAVAAAKADLVRAEARFGQERTRRTTQRLTERCRGEREAVLNGLGAILALREALTGIPGDLNVALTAHFGGDFSAGALAARVARIRGAVAAEVAAELAADGDAGPEEETQASQPGKPRKGGRR